jgi:hypothetical protein
VNTANKHEGTFSKALEEQIYVKMVEDFVRIAFKEKIYLLKLMPTLMHSGFLSAKT